ncbi:hypothetical protein HDC94_001547 [Leifsonia sp. AK011]|uniref:hypothetical protein n=1 Tax=Leifsonia sp. AK011 TaxID=2723075 RepID=UPI0015C89BCB|nr:hypothetical protein [Leifsonia sp. AK011]NYF10391.1 hypothetical protein [Leifsonia sp. AK011]
MRRPAPLPTALAADGFTIASARAAGVGEGRLRSSDLASPFYGVRSLGEPTTVVARSRALQSRMTPDQFFSHSTAAMLLGLRLPEGFRASTVHVTSVRPHRAPRLTGVSGHESGVSALVSVGGLRVLNPIDTWLQLGATLPLDDLVAMGDGLVSRKQPVTTMEQLGTLVRGYRGRGSRKLHEALLLMRSGTDSARETALRLVVMRAGFPEPEVNGVIHNIHSAQVARGDLVFRAYRVVLEYEGRHHGESERQFAIDIARLDELMDEDWRVIRVDKALLARRSALVGTIDRALRKGGWTPST